MAIPKLFSSIVLLAAAISAIPSLAAKPQTAAISLENAAARELDLPAGTNTPASSSTVRIGELPLSHEQDGPGPWSMGLTAQAFRPLGALAIRTGESFSLEGSGSVPMLGIETCYQPGVFGACVRTQAAQNSYVLRSAAGFLYEDVKLRSVLLEIASTLDLALPFAPRLGWGLQAGAGTLAAIQSARNGTANAFSRRTHLIAASHLRWNVTDALFTRATYLHRLPLDRASTLEIQERNVALTLGILL